MKRRNQVLVADLIAESDVFRRYSESGRMREVLSGLGLADPRIVQSQYIFKQPRIGAAVNQQNEKGYT